MIPIEFKKETYDHMDMKRVFLKLSGEALAGPKKTGFDDEQLYDRAVPVLLTVKKPDRDHQVLRPAGDPGG